MLSTTPELKFAGEASSGPDALKAMDSLKPDLVLMDVHMPLMDGPSTAKALLAKHPTTKIVAWTVSESSDDLLRMMRAGCSGYVLKDVGPGELQRALLSALRSESPVPRRMIPEVLRRGGGVTAAFAVRQGQPSVSRKERPSGGGERG